MKEKKKEHAEEFQLKILLKMRKKNQENIQEPPTNKI